MSNGIGNNRSVKGDKSEQRGSDQQSSLDQLWGTIWRLKSWIAALVFMLGGFVAISLILYYFGEEAFHWYRVFEEISITAVISGLLIIAYELAVKESFIRDAKESLKTIHEEQQHFHDAGLKRIRQGLNSDQLSERCENASSIRILQTWLGHDRDQITAIEQAAASSKCKIEILLLDPFSAQVPYRASAVKRTEERVMNDLESHLEALCNIESNREMDGKHDVDVKVYDAAPTIQIYEFDRTKLLGVYWKGKYSVQGSQFEIAGPETCFLAQQIDKHFEDIWNDAKITRDASDALQEYETWKATSLPIKEYREYRELKESTGLTPEKYEKLKKFREDLVSSSWWRWKR